MSQELNIIEKEPGYSNPFNQRRAGEADVSVTFFISSIPDSKFINFCIIYIFLGRAQF